MQKACSALLTCGIVLLVSCSGGGGDSDGFDECRQINANKMADYSQSQTSCTKGDDDNNDATTPVMTTPYVNSSDISPLEEAHLYDPGHPGIDFPATSNLRPFQAVFAGEIITVRLVQLASTSNMQVEVEIRFNSAYSALYAFEPMTSSQADGDTQLANILVSVGQQVSQGEIIGNLFVSGEGSHVHFGLINNNQSPPELCPDPFFSDEARASILTLIQASGSDLGLCS